MVKQKVTITLDRKKAEEARALAGVASTSRVIDVALDRLIWAEKVRRDVTAYTEVPPNDVEGQLAELADTSALGDDTDWESLYGKDPP